MNVCTFCGKPENEVKKLIYSAAHAICNKCVDEAVRALSVEPSSPASKKEDHPLPTPKEILTFLDQHVIAQDTAKQVISVAIYNHYKRREAQKILLDSDLVDVEIKKSNILLAGPSGVGKTELARAVSKILKVPFHVVDATKLTQTGYVGDDVESILQGLLAAADGDVERAEWGIVFIDEISTLARKSGKNLAGYRDVSGEGVQQALLKIVEGSTVLVPRQNAKVDNGQGHDKVNTENILFIAGGSFAGIDEVVKSRLNKSSRIGFGGEGAKRDIAEKTIYDSITEDDILEFGMISEFMGRFPVLTSLLPLTDDEMVRILTEPKNAIVKQFRALFAMNGIYLQIDVDALKAIGREANKRPTGARALRSILESLLRKYIFELAGDTSVKAVHVTQDVVEKKAEATIVRKSTRVPLVAKA